MLQSNLLCYVDCIMNVKNYIVFIQNKFVKKLTFLVISNLKALWFQYENFK